MMKCKICALAIVQRNDYVAIYRVAPFLSGRKTKHSNTVNYHTACFASVSGKQYVPRLIDDCDNPDKNWWDVR